MAWQGSRAQHGQAGLKSLAWLGWARELSMAELGSAAHFAPPSAGRVWGLTNAGMAQELSMAWQGSMPTVTGACQRQAELRSSPCPAGLGNSPWLGWGSTASLVLPGRLFVPGVGKGKTTRPDNSHSHNQLMLH